MSVCTWSASRNWSSMARETISSVLRRFKRRRFEALLEAASALSESVSDPARLGAMAQALVRGAEGRSRDFG